MQLKENEQERKDRTGEMALGIKGLLPQVWILDPQIPHESPLCDCHLGNQHLGGKEGCGGLKENGPQTEWCY